MNYMIMFANRNKLFYFVYYFAVIILLYEKMDYDIKITSKHDDITFNDVEETIYLFMETVISLILMVVTTVTLLQLCDYFPRRQQSLKELLELLSK